jgi:hypothetical protein
MTGTTPNHKIPFWLEYPLNFPGRVTDEIRVLWVSTVPLLADVWGVSKAEARRRLQQQQVRECGLSGPPVQPGEVMVQLGCAWVMPHGNSFHTIVFVDIPRPWHRRLTDWLLSRWEHSPWRRYR